MGKTPGVEKAGFERQEEGSKDWSETAPGSEGCPLGTRWLCAGHLGFARRR